MCMTITDSHIVQTRLSLHLNSMHKELLGSSMASPVPGILAAFVVMSSRLTPSFTITLVLFASSRHCRRNPCPAINRQDVGMEPFSMLLLTSSAASCLRLTNAAGKGPCSWLWPRPSTVSFVRLAKTLGMVPTS